MKLWVDEPTVTTAGIRYRGHQYVEAAVALPQTASTLSLRVSTQLPRENHMQEEKQARHAQATREFEKLLEGLVAEAMMSAR